MRLKVFNHSDNIQRQTQWLLFFITLFVSSLDAKKIRPTGYLDSFDKLDSARWEIEGKAEIIYGRAAFSDQKKSFIKFKNALAGEDWKVQFLVKYGLNAGEFSIDLMQKNSKAPTVSAVMKWTENEGEGEVNLSFTNSVSGKPVVDSMMLHAIVMEQWQLVELEKRAHKMLLKINHQKISEFIWEGDAFLTLSGMSSGEFLVDDFKYIPLDENYYILDSVSIPGYGESIPGWESLSGTWGSIFLPRSRQKVIAQTSKEAGILYFKENLGNDFVMTVDCRLEQGKMIGLGLVDPENGKLYRLVMESENSVGLRFEHVDNEKVKLLNRSEKIIFPGVWNQVKLKLWNGHCHVWFDGQKTFDHIKVPYGLKPCLISSGTQTALFRNLVLKEEQPTLYSGKMVSFRDESVLSPGDWQPELKAILKKNNKQAAELQIGGMSRHGDYRMLSSFKINKDNAHVIFEFTSGLNRSEFHFVKEQGKWYTVKLVKEKGDLKEVPVSSEMQKIVFRNMNQDLTIVELKELGLDLHTENDLMISKASSQSHNMSFILNTQELGRLSMKSKGELKCRMLSYGTTELSDLRFKILSRDYQAWLKHQNPSNTLVSNSGVLSLTGGTFDDRSLKEGKFFAFSDFLKEGGEFALDVSAREGQGKVGFFLEDLHAETYALGSLSVAESDDSVWINPDEETVGIENKDGKPKVLKIKRVQQRAIIIYGDKLLGEIPLYTSIPTRVYITRLSGTFQLNSYRFKDRAVENSVDFMNFTWLKTNSRPLKFNFDFYSRLKSTTDWKGLYQHASEGNGNGFELEPDLPRRFILKLDSDYRSIKDLSFEQDFKLVGEGGEVSVKILQLEKGIEILLSIGGEIKFRKPYLSKIINFNLVMDGEKLGIYTNGYLIGEEMLLSEHPWTFQTEVTSTDPSYLKMSTLSWSEY